MKLRGNRLTGALEDVRALCAVVDLGSISAAAKQLRETKGSVSRRISRLEARLGATLLARTPRSVSPTEEGLAFCEKARDALMILDDATEGARQAASEPTGLLRVTAPPDLGLHVLPELIVGFCETYRQVNVELILSNTALDLAANRIDLALRATTEELPDTGYRASRVVEFELGLYAAPDYLRRHVVPNRPNELTQHQFVAFREGVGGAFRLRLTRPRTRPSEIQLQPQLRVNDFATVHRLVVAGGGIGAMPDLIAARWVIEGRLVRVLPDWSAGRARLHAVTVAGREAPARVRVFKEFLRERLGGLR